MTTKPVAMTLADRLARRFGGNRDQGASVLFRSPLRSGADMAALPLRTEAASAQVDVVPLQAVRDQTEWVGAVDAATLKSAGMTDWIENSGRVSEEFQLVQAHLLQAMTAATVKASTLATPGLSNIVMVTSAKPGEGKTFSALNLGGSLASSSRKRVILVDWDFRRPTLSNRLKLSDRPGLRDLQSGSGHAPDDLLVGTCLPGLSILPIGQRDELAMLAGCPAVEVLRQLGEHYPDRTIVLDMPSCLSSSDCSQLAPLAVMIVMVVQAQKTQSVEVEAALDLIEACPSIVLLLNKLQLTGSNTFGAYDY